jgi:hypothetical protein
MLYVASAGEDSYGFGQYITALGLLPGSAAARKVQAPHSPDPATLKPDLTLRIEDAERFR